MKARTNYLRAFTILLALTAAVGVGALTSFSGQFASAQTPPPAEQASAWGYNDFGEVGDGTSNNNRTTPVPVSGLATGTSAVAGGEFHSLALTKDGTVWAWGDNQYGQLGNEAYTNTNPHPTPLAVYSGVTAVASGANHILALKSDGTVQAWGHNDSGQVGNGGSLGDEYTPVQVSGLTGVKAVAGGVQHSLALKNDGTVWAWGFNQDGELGNGTTSTSAGCRCINTPAQVKDSSDPSGYLQGVTAVASGGFHNLALKSDGTVMAWGYNGQGEVGNGTTSTSGGIPTPVRVSSLTGVKAVGSGEFHSLAIKSDDTVVAWGDNSSGQLGNGTTSTSGCKCINTPAQVIDLTGAKAVTGGRYHSLVLKNDGTAWAWGDNSGGQLGDGTSPTDSTTPVQVSGLTGVTAVASGYYHNLSIGPNTTPPSVALTAPTDGKTVGGSVTLSADASDEAGVKRVEFLVNDSVVESDTTSPYAFDWDSTSIADGTVTLAARAYDNAGNQATSTTRQVTVDNTAPAKPVITSPANNSYDNDGSFSVKGTAEANSSLELFEGTTSKGTATADPSGSWSVDLTGVSEGSHSYTANATDPAGNTSTASSDAVTVTVETTAPTTTADAGSYESDTWTNQDVTLTLTADDGQSGSGVDKIYYNTDGSSTYQEYTAPLSFTSDTQTTVYYYAVDEAGNKEDPPKTFTVKIDKTVPDAPSISSPADGTTTNDSTPTFSGKAEADGKVTVYDGSTELGTANADGSGDWSFTPSSALSNSTHSISASATDAAGNASAASGPINITVDTTSPSAPAITSPQNNTHTISSFSVKGTAAPGTTVQLFEGSTSKGTAKTSSGGTWSMAIKGVAEGSHTYTAKATKTGRTSGPSDSLTVIVDNTKPSVSSVTPTANQTGVPRTTSVTATFSEEMNPSTLTGSTVKLLGANKKPVPVSLSYAGNTVTLDPTTDLPPNSKYTVTITTGAKDLAGNALARSFSWTFTTGS